MSAHSKSQGGVQSAAPLKAGLDSDSDGDSFTKADYERLRGLVDERLAVLFDEAKDPSRLACAIRHGLLSPGKRLRPIITLLACAQSGGVLEDAIDLACAIELVHAASLIMDDLPAMDNARLRRGCLTTHMVFGEGTTMLAAVAMLNEAYRMIASAPGLSTEQRLNCSLYLADAIGADGLTGGQERDIMCGRDNDQRLTMSEIEQRHAEKTGALFVAAAAIGGEVAGAAPDSIDALKRFGSTLGLAYQAFDDMIDQQCSAKETGKDAGQDAGKSTVVSIAGADAARRNATRHLEDAISAAEDASAPGNTLTSAPLSGLARMIGNKFCTLTS